MMSNKRSLRNILFMVTEMERGDKERIIQTNLSKYEAGKVLEGLKSQGCEIIVREGYFLADSPEGDVTYYVRPQI